MESKALSPKEQDLDSGTNHLSCISVFTALQAARE